MAYVKNTWVDQNVERPKTYEVTNNTDGSITLTDSFGNVTELGTPVNATNMNHIEDGIDGVAIRKYSATETYNLGEWVLGGSGDDEGIYKSLVANNLNNALTDTTKWIKVELGGNSRNIGEIVQSTIPLTDAGLHLLDGSLLAYGSYQAFIDYIADLYDSGNYDDIFDTEANWQSSVTTYGVCGKFVYDSNDNTVRLPKITGFTEGTIDPTVLGDLVQAGLPNISGSLTATCSGANGSLPTRTGCMDASGTSTMINAGTGAVYVNNAKISVDASRSSSIYGNSSTVQPQAIKVLYYIVIATSTKTNIQVDIDEIATDLNGKADVDLTNVNDAGTSLAAGWSMPSSTYEDLTLGASNATYVAPANGWVQFTQKITNGNIWISVVYPNNDGLCVNDHNPTNNAVILNCCLPVKKSETYKVGYNGTMSTDSANRFQFVYVHGSESEA